MLLYSDFLFNLNLKDFAACILQGRFGSCQGRLEQSLHIASILSSSLQSSSLLRCWVSRWPKSMEAVYCLVQQNVSTEDRVEFSWPPRAAAVTFPGTGVTVLTCWQGAGRPYGWSMAVFLCFLLSMPVSPALYSAQFRILFWIGVYLLLRINRESLLAFEYS